MPKRAALLFDRLLVALQKIVDNQEKDLIESKSISKSLVHRFQAANSERVPVADNQMVMNSVLTFKQSIRKDLNISSHIVRQSNISQLYSYFNITYF